MNTFLKDRAIRTLRWSERYVKIDMVYLASGGFWSVVGQFSASLIAFVLAIAMARYVPKDVYGQYKYILAVIALLGTFSLNNVGGAVLQSAAQGFRTALADGFWANLRWSFIVFAGALSIGSYYLYHGNAALGFGILLGGCTAPFLSGFNLYGPFLSGLKEFRTVTWYSEFLTNFIPMVTLVTIALVQPTPIALLLGYFASNTLAAGYAYWRTLRRFGDTRSHDPHMVTYGKHLSFMGILSGIAWNIDQLLLFHFGGALNLAVYNFAIAIPDQSKGPLKMLDSMFQARFVARSHREVRDTMANKMLWLFLFSLVFILAYVALAPYIFAIFFPRYSDAVFYSQLYVVSQLGLMFAPAGSYMTAKKMVREQYIATVGISLFQIATMTVGVIMGGLLGLIIARVVTRIVGPIATYLLYSFSKEVR